ncbi:MAG: sugar ABC transporter substrate-binding protein [Solirubrobacteraceae bacterium]
MREISEPSAEADEPLLLATGDGTAAAQRGRPRRTLRRTLLAGGAVLATVAIAACGSSESKSASSSSSGSSSSSTSSEGSSTEASKAVAEAEGKVKELEKRPTEFSVPPLPKKPTPGQTIDYIACGLPICIAQQAFVREAAEAVGWHFKFLNAGLSPTSVDAAYEQAVHDKPAGVIGTGGFAPELFVHQLAKLKEEKVPVVLDDTEHPKPGVTEIVASEKFQEEKGEEIGQWILANSKGENAHVGIITTPLTPVYSNTHNGIKKYIGGTSCKSCSVTEYQFPEENIGTKLPTEIVTFLRTHPEINYIFTDFANELDGVPAALKSAGLSEKVKLTTTDSGNIEDGYLKKGEEAATAADPWYEAYWGMFDAILRVNQGAPLKPNEEIQYPRMLFTPTSVITTSTGAPPPLVANFREVYKKAWHVG